LGNAWLEFGSDGWNLVSLSQHAFIGTMLSNALFDHGWNLEYLAETSVIQVL